MMGKFTKRATVQHKHMKRIVERELARFSVFQTCILRLRCWVFLTFTPLVRQPR